VRSAAGLAALVVFALTGCSERPVSPASLRAGCGPTTVSQPSAETLRRTVAEHAIWLASANDPAGRKGHRATWRATDLQKVELEDVDLTDADLEGANLTGATLRKTRLRRANLRCAVLDLTKLTDARLDFANLQKASLAQTNLSGASLFDADLRGASLWQTRLSGADLERADVRAAWLDQTNLDGARVYRAKLSGAVYRPANAPAPGYVARLEGLTEVQLDQPDYAGLAQLRTGFKTAGLNDSERQVTYAIERWRTNFLLRGRTSDRWERAWNIVQGVLRWMLFDVTTSYGMRPQRALWAVIWLWAVGAIVYLQPLSTSALTTRGIFATRPATRLITTAGGFAEAGTVDVRPLAPTSWCTRIGWAAYFSLLSILSIGFRELNFQSWLLRLHRHEVTYQSAGWVRVMAGVESLIGLYLIALFGLTYFGRPFD
jgi:Pentapeptide repeats (8 copies)